jgi:hypothetical protein
LSQLSGCVNGVKEGFKQLLRGMVPELLSGLSIQFVSSGKKVLCGMWLYELAFGAKSPE